MNVRACAQLRAAQARKRVHRRVDFIVDPRTEHEKALVRHSYAQIFETKWDGGYDVDLYSSFGDGWQHTHPAWASRLENLGVIEMARAYEAAMRKRRDSSPR